MGAVGLSFGSPTSGQGFDVATTVAAIVANLTAAETPYKTQLTNLHAEDTVISNLGTLMSTLSTDIDNLSGATGALSALTGSSSDTGVLQLTGASTGATAGTHSIVVSQLAQTASAYGSPVASTDSLSGSLSIQVGTGAAISVAVDSTNDTLSGLAASINQSNAGVTASVIEGSSGAQLSLVSGTSGAAGGITLDASGLTDATTNAGITFTSGPAAQDAMMTVDGIAATSSSNTVTSVLPGVTFQLLGTSTAPVQVNILNDTSTMSTAVTTLVKDYNAVVSALTTQEGNTTAGAAEPLYGNPLVATLQEQLESAISGSGTSGTSTLSSIGIAVNANGSLSLDSDTLATALSTNFNSVVGLFQGVGGVGETLTSTVDALGSTLPTGVLALAASENASQETDLNSTITALGTNITAQTASLTASLNAANETLQSIPLQIQEVNQLYSAITGYGQNSNG